METFAFDQDRYLAAPDEDTHLKDCPAEGKPWKPGRCICREIEQQYRDDRAAARRNGE